MDHETFSETVEMAQKERGYWLADHELVRTVVDGSATIEQIRDWAKQFFVTVTRVHRHAHGRPKLPLEQFDADMKRYMWENRVEEEYGALSNTAGHVELMLRLTERLGLSRLDMAKARPAPATQRLLDVVGAICRERPTVQSQIMLGFVEAMMPAACERLTAGLRQNYDMSDDDVRFFSVHIFADEEHGDIAKRMVALVPEEDLEGLADVVLEYSRLFNEMWSAPLALART